MGKTKHELQSELMDLRKKYTALKEKHLDETNKLKKENDELKYKLMFLDGVANSTYDGFLVVNPYGQKILQNQRTIELWKIPKDIVNDPDGLKQVNHVMHMTVNPKKFVSEIDYLREHPNEKSRDELELIDGTILERYSAPVIGNDNINYGRIWTFHDITERKEIEKQLIQLNSDKDRFISILAHDMRSPFNSLLGFSYLLRKNIESYPLDKIKNMVDTIYKTLQSTLKLLEDTLLWANLKSQNFTFRPGMVNIHEIISEVVQFLNHSNQLKKISIENKVGSETEVFADVYMIKAILRNLISNAIKFTNLGGTVSISVVDEKTKMIFRISDNGVGIEPERIKDMFRFSAYKSTRGTGNEKGTGLGLLLCKEFIEKHDGKIWMESQINKGTDVYFTLPIPT